MAFLLRPFIYSMTVVDKIALKSLQKAQQWGRQKQKTANQPTNQKKKTQTKQASIKRE